MHGCLGDAGAAHGTHIHTCTLEHMIYQSLDRHTVKPAVTDALLRPAARGRPAALCPDQPGSVETDGSEYSSFI